MGDATEGATAQAQILEGELHVKWGGDGATTNTRYKLPFSDDPKSAAVERSENEVVEDDEGEEEEEEYEEEEKDEEANDLALQKKSDEHVWTCTMVPLGLRIGNQWVGNLDYSQIPPQWRLLLQYKLS